VKTVGACDAVAVFVAIGDGEFSLGETVSDGDLPACETIGDADDAQAATTRTARIRGAPLQAACPTRPEIALTSQRRAADGAVGRGTELGDHGSSLGRVAHDVIGDGVDELVGNPWLADGSQPAEPRSAAASVSPSARASCRIS